MNQKQVTSKSPNPIAILEILQEETVSIVCPRSDEDTSVKKWNRAEEKFVCDLCGVEYYEHSVGSWDDPAYLYSHPVGERTLRKVTLVAILPPKEVPLYEQLGVSKTCWDEMSKHWGKNSSGVLKACLSELGQESNAPTTNLEIVAKVSVLIGHHLAIPQRSDQQSFVAFVTDFVKHVLRAKT